MIRAMDEGIGRVLAAVDENGIRDNTLIVFTSDNGGERYSDSWPLMGKKMDMLEGGIRVPYIARWPTHIKPGSTSDRFVMGMDWLPTFLSAAGVGPHPDYPLDGYDVFGPEVKDRKLFWRMLYRNQKAVRWNDWKWLSIEGSEFLYNIAMDERERANMRYREPKRFVELRNVFREWDASMPLFPGSARFDLVYTEQTMARSSG
jgi:arylsulfatase A-like enzyme